MPSTMGNSGVHRQHRESARRFNETRDVKPDAMFTIRPATQQQVSDALREEQYHGIPMDIELVKEGLYNPQDKGSVFHIDNFHELAGLIAQTAVTNRDTSTKFSLELDKENGVYGVQREHLQKVLTLLAHKPELKHVN